MPRKTRNKRNNVCDRGDGENNVNIQAEDTCQKLFKGCVDKDLYQQGKGPKSLNCAKNKDDIGKPGGNWRKVCSTPDGENFKGNTNLDMGEWCKYQWSQ